MKRLALAILTTIAFGAPVVALEKRAERIDWDPRSEWNGSGRTMTLFYYNTCTGWVWVWSDWEPGARLAVHHTIDCPLPFGGEVHSTYIAVSGSQPSGYGFTGTIFVGTFEDACVPSVYDSQPSFVSEGWNGFYWHEAVPIDFSVGVTMGTEAVGLNPVGLVTDHPSAGSSGPAACGFCYPNPRASRTYYLGTGDSPLCPGTGLSDGSCDAELSLVTVGVEYCLYLGVERASWGKIKNLYR